MLAGLHSTRGGLGDFSVTANGGGNSVVRQGAASRRRRSPDKLQKPFAACGAKSGQTSLYPIEATT
jgi:hypothetical protein